MTPLFNTPAQIPATRSVTPSELMRQVRDENFQLAFAPDAADWPGLRSLNGFRDYDALVDRAQRVPGGRTEHMLFSGPDWPQAVRCRPAHHGGAFARWTADRFLRPIRVFKELALLIDLQEKGIPVARPVFATARRERFFWRCTLATVDQPEALDGLAFIRQDFGEACGKAAPEESASLHARPAAKQLEAARALGAALRQLHDAGVLHGDLQLRNILFSQTADCETLLCRFIDFDRAQTPPAISAADRMKEWMRLIRSTQKNDAQIPPRSIAAAFSTYCADDRNLRREMRKRLAPELRRQQRHEAGWRLRSMLPRSAARGKLALTFFILSAALLGAGCDAPPKDAFSPIDAPRLSLLAVGDTGRTRILPSIFEGQRSVAQAMTTEAKRRPVDGVVFLGDNFYWDGLSNATLVPRIRENLVTPYCYFLDLTGPRSSEVESACPLAIPQRKPTPIYAVLGNHDLERPESAELQRKVVPEFIPAWQMSPGLARAVELGQGVSLILFESEPSIDDRETLIRELRAAIRSARGPWRILATHRPIATDDYGTPWLGGYPTFVRDAIEAEGKPVQLVLAAHHHNLQAFEVGAPIPSLQLGLGSGSRAEEPLASPDHPDIRFSRRVLGFARIDLVGQASDERLVATLFESPDLPITERFTGSRSVARLSVDKSGRVTSTP